MIIHREVRNSGYISHIKFYELDSCYAEFEFYNRILYTCDDDSDYNYLEIPKEEFV